MVKRAGRKEPQPNRIVAQNLIARSVISCHYSIYHNCRLLMVSGWLLLAPCAHTLTSGVVFGRVCGHIIVCPTGLHGLWIQPCWIGSKYREKLFLKESTRLWCACEEVKVYSWLEMMKNWKGDKIEDDKGLSWTSSAIKRLETFFKAIVPHMWLQARTASRWGDWISRIVSMVSEECMKDRSDRTTFFGDGPFW